MKTNRADAELTNPNHYILQALSSELFNVALTDSKTNEHKLSNEKKITVGAKKRWSYSWHLVTDFLSKGWVE